MTDKLVNADYGIDSVVADARKRRWWNNAKFPLVPLFDYRHGDDWNAPDFNFSWLFLRVWTIMSPEVRVEVGIGEDGIFVGGILVYLRWFIWVLPFPSFIRRWSYNHLWRLGSDRRNR